MEGYKKELMKELVIYRVLHIIFLVMFVVALIFADKSKLFVNYMVFTGMLGGLIGLTGGRYRRAKKALKDEESLKKSYVESHDERNVLLGRKTSDTTFAISMYGFAISGIIASFFSAMVAITLFVSFLVICVVHLATYWYYSKRM